MKFMVLLQADEDGFIVAECPSLPGCFSQGRTKVEALANINDAIALCIKTRRDNGLHVPVEADAEIVEIAA
jgi:predicted RNase H-like HicB family nuclease